MTERCVGCGATVEKIEGPVHRYMTSAPGCWARYGELLGALAIAPSLQAARVMCVDAYAAQHPGTPNPQAIQSVATHLINIHAYVVRKRPVSIPRISGPKGVFHWMTPPSFASARTVFDVPVDATGEALTAAARAWAESVWAAWSPHHAQIESWSASYATS
jgi:hypothetical protein